jgi:signal peptidase I
MPAAEGISRSDIVVFNWPVDTVHYFFEPKGPGVIKPVDKKSNYVKDALVSRRQLIIINGMVYIDGKLIPESQTSIFIQCV